MTAIVQSVFFLIFNIISVTESRCCLDQRVSEGSTPVRAEELDGGVRERNSTEGQSLAPRDVSLEWINDFKPQLSWKPPPYLPGDCCFCVRVQATMYSEKDLHSNQSNFSDIFFTKENSLNMSVQTICNNMTSDPVIMTNIYSELVSALDCYIISTNQTRCSWTPVPSAPKSQFFYRLIAYGKPATNLLSCPYLHTDGESTVCDMRTPDTRFIQVLFNGTVGDKPVRNTFETFLYVKPSVSKWSVKKADSQFTISWVSPDIPNPYKREFVVVYTECAVSKSSHIIKRFHYEIVRQPSCRYCFAIETHIGEDEARTEDKCFDADPDVFVLAAIIVPLTCAGLAALALVYCIRNKDYIFPPIPKPRDLLSDISDNNNKVHFGNLYFPLEVEELFKITLVMDPPIDTRDS